MFNLFKKRQERKQKAFDFYTVIEGQARQPVFYTDFGVPDTTDGRFDMIALHCFIMMYRFQKAGEKKLSQALFDRFFKIMELSLRERGIGDMGVPKHMKRMMQGFNGRARQYAAALKEQNRTALIEALNRNVYGSLETPDRMATEKLADYVEQSAAMAGCEAVFAVLPIEKKRESQHA